MTITRRFFLQGSLGAGLAMMLGCADEEGAPGLGDGGLDGEDIGAPDGGAGEVGAPDSGEDEPEDLPPAECGDPFAGGRFVALAAFVNEFEGDFSARRSAGHDGRLNTDLRQIEPGQLSIPNDRYYIRTFYPDKLDPDLPWQIRVHGRVAAEVTLTMDDLLPRSRPMGNHVMECSGNTFHNSFGLMSAADWSGVPLLEVLEGVELLPGGTRVLVAGFDEHTHVSTHSTLGASWIFTLDDIRQAGGFLATHMNGALLPPDHGQPVRLYMPNWYGCSCIKWVNEIKIVGEDEPATAQMREFAQRTHQRGEPEMARDYRPATMDQAAMPIRVERWIDAAGETLHRIIGIMWGGYEVTGALQISTDDDGLWEPVDVCPAQAGNKSWTFWTHAWSPGAPGDYTIMLRVDDPDVPTRRLDVGHYARTVRVDQA